MSRAHQMAIVAVATSLVFSATASATETIKYTYDARGRLVKVERDPASTTNTYVQTCYKYDKADNRTNVKTTTAQSPLPPCP